VRPVLTAAAFAAAPRPTLVVVAGEEAAERYARQAGAYLGPGAVLRFPERRDAPWSDEAPDVAAVGARARALHALSSGSEVVVVASTRGLVRALPPQGSHVFEPLVLEVGAEIDLEETAAGLARMAYERRDAAEEPGTFAVRGGVLDVFPSDGTAPVRAELFGDEVETLRRFVPSTGQTIGDAGRILVFGCREVVLGSRAASAARKALAARAQSDSSRRSPPRTHRTGRLLQRHRALPARLLQAGRRAHRLPRARGPRDRGRAALALRRRRAP
jgi:transcription-repair coupling factor (superfamily II helicase)